jgi:hypothetical protein
VQFQTKRDLARLKRLGNELDHCEELLRQADTPAKRQTAEGLIRAKRNEIRSFRTYPFGIWVFGMSVLAPLVPWAVLTRDGHAVLGVTVGLALAALVIASTVWRRKRSNPRD